MMEQDPDGAIFATRRVVLNGVTHEKGARVEMCDQQFADLQPTGFFRRARGRKPVKADPAAS